MPGTELSEPMETAILTIGDLLWLYGIRWDTWKALLRRGLVVRNPGPDKMIGLTEEGLATYWRLCDKYGSPEGGPR